MKSILLNILSKQYIITDYRENALKQILRVYVFYSTETLCLLINNSAFPPHLS